MEHPNVDVLRRGYDALEKAEVETVRGLLADDVVCHVAGSSILAGEYVGHDEVFDLIVRLIELSDATHHVVVQDVVADDRLGVVFAVHEMRRDDVLHRFQAVHVWALRDGKGERLTIYPTDVYAFDGFLGRTPQYA